MCYSHWVSYQCTAVVKNSSYRLHYGNGVCRSLGAIAQRVKLLHQPHIVIPSVLLSFLWYYCHSFRIIVIPSILVSFLPYFCHSFRIIVIPSELLPFQTFVILNSSCTLPYLKGEKIGRQSGPYLQVGSKNPRSWQPQTCIYFMLHAYNCLLDSTQTAVSRILQKNCVNCPQFKNNMVGFIYTFCFFFFCLLVLY